MRAAGVTTSSDNDCEVTGVERRSRVWNECDIAEEREGEDGVIRTD